MPLSDSTLFADRTMLRLIFIALDAMALFSDACLFFKHVCNFFPLFRLQSYNFFPINPSTFSNFLPIEVLIVIKILVAHQLCNIPTLPFFGVMQSYILQARTGDRSLSRRHERPLLWTVYQWSQCSASLPLS